MDADSQRDPVGALYREGRQEFDAMVDGGGSRLDALFRAVPALGELAVGTVYGHLRDRAGLDPRAREAATLAAIVAAGMVGPPLSVHVRTGLAAGLAPGEITELVLQAAAFAGFPRAVSAADMLNRLFDELEVDTPPPPPPREIVLSACRRVREGEDEPGVDEAAAARLRPAAEFVATAIGAEQVVVVCREQGAAALALLLGTTRDGQLEALTAYTPETADGVG